MTALGYRVERGQLTDWAVNALRRFEAEHPGVDVYDNGTFRVFNRGAKPQDHQISMTARRRWSGIIHRTYAQLNEQPERVLAEMLRELDDTIPLPSAWMAL